MSIIRDRITPKGIKSLENQPETVEKIRKGIKQVNEDVRIKYPFLQYQSQIGLILMFLSIVGVVGSGYLYLSETISAFVCIVSVAFFTSILHELEHDLIHNLYFKKHKSVQNFMLGMVWLFRPGTVNPWIRRHLHFLHHKVSGTEHDLEERGISNGRKYGFMRFWILMDTFVGNLIAVIISEETLLIKARHLLRLFFANFPLAIITSVIWYSFLFYHGLNYAFTAMGNSIDWSADIIGYMETVNLWVVLLVGPFYLRSFCLNFISSNMHYYGGVDSTVKQTQVLNDWYFAPFNLFCFNFGSTHGIHHFVVGEPFYVRQFGASESHKIMKENGVRFNDIGTFKRKNHYESEGFPKRVSVEVS